MVLHQQQADEILIDEFHLVTGLPCWIKEDEVPIDFECDWPLLPDKPPIKGKDAFDMLVSSVKDDDKKKNVTKIDVKGFPMAYARLDDKSDRFLVCARYLSTVQPSYEQIMSKREDLEIGRDVMHLFSTNKMWKLSDGSDADADVGETQMQRCRQRIARVRCQQTQMQRRRQRIARMRRRRRR
ncbi:unnamed protein product [Arabidopsis thaliana]|uniref:Genomic DNA, chromosome 3, BAC clone:T13B17 n=1 Tax=Arabidopsis thaliana TaxID=3702 RepID=Q9LH06_ARATH|nr:unnamed protein product [Arabidopsis thaliana]